MKTALYIDFDNFSNENEIENVINKISKTSSKLYKYIIFSDDKQGKSNINKIANKFNILCIYQPKTTSNNNKNNKNINDIRIIIECVRKIYEDKINRICIASNDKDFSPLKTVFDNQNVVGVTIEIYKYIDNNDTNMTKVIENNNETEKNMIDSIFKEEYLKICKKKSSNSVNFGHLVSCIKNKYNDIPKKYFKYNDIEKNLFSFKKGLKQNIILK